MLLFSTTLELSGAVTADEFISLVIEWTLAGSRIHPENAVPGMDWKGEHNIRYGNDRLWLDIQEYRNGNIVAVRYENQGEDGIVWDTDFVMNFNSGKLTVRLERSYTEEALVSDSGFSSPYFITMLIDRGWVLDDKDLPVTYDPVYITNKNAQVLTEVVTVARAYSLPVVYISKTEYDKDPLNVRKLAWDLKGAAHVFVETSRLMNDSLLVRCGGQIEKDGEAGVYFPNQTRAPRRYAYWAGEGTDQKLHKIVSKTVLSWCNAQKTDPLDTWFGVNNALLQDRLLEQRRQRQLSEEKVRLALYERHLAEMKYSQEIADIERKAGEAARAETDRFLEEFSGELESCEEQIRSLMGQVARLEAENSGLRNKLNALDNEPILHMGQKEQDYYPGEVKDLVLSTLDKSLKQLSAGTRRYDVVKDIIEGNDFQDISSEKANEAVRLLTGYTKLNPRIWQGLEKLGFVLTDEGKHVKGKYYGDPRYTVTYGKTPSDTGRAGKNNAMETRKVAF